MNVSDLLVDLTTPIQNSRRKSDNVVDLTEEDEDIQFIQPPTKRQKQRLSNQQSTIQPFPILEPPALDPAFSTTHRERRAAQYVSSPSKELLTRIQRSQNSKLFLIQQKPQQPDRLEKDFVIYGTNGNVYTVTIGQKPLCDCEENQRGQFPVHCEHILFVYLKVLRRSPQDPVVFQKALLRTELTELFSSAGSVTPSVLADPCVTEKYLEIMRADRKKPKKSVPQKPIDGDCPVCYEKMKPSEDLIYCKHSCGNSIHKECFDQWRRVRKEANQEARCIYCRSKWEEDPESIKKALMKNGYLNLSEFQTTIRDIPHPYYFLLPQLLRLSDRFNFDLSNDLNDSSDDEDYYDGESGEDLENTDNEDDEDF